MHCIFIHRLKSAVTFSCVGGRNKVALAHKFLQKVHTRGRFIMHGEMSDQYPL